MTFASPATAFARRLLARPAVALVLSAAALVAAAPAVPAAAQAAPPTRIAVINLQRVYAEMQERKAISARFEDEDKRLKALSNEKLANLKKMQADRDNNYKPGTPQYEDVNAKLIDATAAYKVWGEAEQAKLGYLAKKQTRAMFDKIQAASAEVAKKEAFDLVIVDANEKISDEQADQLDPKRLQAILFSKSVLYAAEKNDITQLVITVLDGRYKAGGAGK